ncbi:uncharacterized protein HaLaN_00197 [Haematococcus lacustris]|uniref:Uncharacterized protein n=1 Tax=Haematococcus lacustris TaxID=44745 RepID=A0A699YF38_HAELA|nr:hypothetical protein QJQ45_009272 [Haematococcus lacustris]KAJ9526419.1 hypothetical protein QJQ45_009886 [Haematococcus lacustris]KAJ9526421.1 hypothetical protein QJQ45_009888 [Haematococcus lacustris]GFH05696.1 uncharacterized protein HaLaN_00197 [Haematococcus lacustris]
MSQSDAFALWQDGTAKDPRAFQAALKADSERLAVIQQDPELSAILLGSNMDALQKLLRDVYREEQAKVERRAQRLQERSIDAQRASATIPRDTVQLYAQLRATGLEYGKSFRLLRNVHVPDPMDAALLSQ